MRLGLRLGQLARLPSSAPILDALTDQQMLQYMGGEDGEDYAPDFSILGMWQSNFSIIQRLMPKPSPAKLPPPRGAYFTADLRGLSVLECRQILTRAQGQIDHPRPPSL